MRGNLTVLSRILSVFCDDMNYPGASQAEREAVVIMGALHAAIVLDKTGELVALLDAWADEHEPLAVRKLMERRQRNDITSPPTGG